MLFLSWSSLPVFEPVTGVTVCTGNILSGLVLVVAGKTVRQLFACSHLRVLAHPVSVVVIRTLGVTAIAEAVGPGKVGNLVACGRSGKLGAFLVIVTLSAVVHILTAVFTVNALPFRILVGRQAGPLRIVVTYRTGNSHFTCVVAVDTHKHVRAPHDTGSRLFSKLSIPLVIVGILSSGGYLPFADIPVGDKPVTA